MAEVLFNYKGNNIAIHCNVNDKMKDIINKFEEKIEIEQKNIEFHYFYGDNAINNELAYIEQVNELDKANNKMSVIVKISNENKLEIKEMISKDIICPECKEITLLNIKDLKMNFEKCKNNHNINNILLPKFEESQKIDITKIVCDICNKHNIINNYEIFICNTCDKTICSLCKFIHDKNHLIINYVEKDYICKKHNESFNKYCKTCNKDICFNCENEHNNHDIFDFNNKNN